MGVNLRDLFPQHPLPSGWLDGKRIAVDGHNVAFRYLAAFRGDDGHLRQGVDGRPIGHLIGFVNLVRHLRERGAEPIVVWDGQVHHRKRETVDERKRVRHVFGQAASTLEAELRQSTLLGLAAFGAAHRQELQAQVRLLEALLPSDPEAAAELEERRSRVARAAKLSDSQLGAHRTVELEQEVLEARRRVTELDGRMIGDATRLLAALGVAVVDAPHDGERYAAALCQGGHADVVATEDFDALVSGAPAVLRKVGSLDCFLHRLSDLDGHGLTHRQLRHVAILCGTDFNDGVKGFGAKTAAKMLREHDVRQLIAEAEAGSDSTRYHVLLRASGMTLAKFDDLDAFLADLPQVVAPARPRDDPAELRRLSQEFGLEERRLMAAL